jgi:hypothetical protein
MSFMSFYNNPSLMTRNLNGFGWWLNEYTLSLIIKTQNPKLYYYKNN